MDLGGFVGSLLYPGVDELAWRIFLSLQYFVVLIASTHLSVLLVAVSACIFTCEC